MKKMLKAALEWVVKILEITLAFAAVAIALISIAWGWAIVGNRLALWVGLGIILLMLPWRLAKAQEWETARTWALRVFAMVMLAIVVNTCWVFRIPHVDVSPMTKAVALNGQVLNGDFYFYTPSWPLPQMRTLDEHPVVDVAILPLDRDNHTSDGLALDGTVRVHLELLPYTDTRSRLLAEKDPTSRTTSLTVHVAGNAMYDKAHRTRAGKLSRQDLCTAVQDRLEAPLKKRGYRVALVEIPDLKTVIH